MNYSEAKEIEKKARAYKDGSTMITGARYCFNANGEVLTSVCKGMVKWVKPSRECFIMHYGEDCYGVSDVLFDSDHKAIPMVPAEKVRKFGYRPGMATDVEEISAYHLDCRNKETSGIDRITVRKEA